ncbi:MAG: glycosyltransferase family 2 protein [Chloroflexota bacterium]
MAIALDETLRGDVGAIIGTSYDAVLLETPLEALRDVWPVLRALRSTLEDGGRVSVRTSRAHGHMIARNHVANLFRLTGYRMVQAVRTADGFAYVAQKRPIERRDLSCSVIVPCRNEEDNVRPLARRLPRIGTETELIYVDGDSTDDTVSQVQRLIIEEPDRTIRLLHQRGPGGKAAAVFQGFDEASGDVLVILDADMTVAPEDLERFFLALAEGVGDFANGTRFAYPIARGAMPPLNKLGNRAFGTLFSWLMGTHISDTLCGTKTLFRRDWPRIRDARRLFGHHDPWGDFDLLLGARHAGLRVIDVPVRYEARVAGESKMRPLRHGAVLARTTAAGIRQLKLKPGTRSGRGR